MKRDPLTRAATILCLTLFFPSSRVLPEEPAKKDPPAEPSPGAPGEKEEAPPPKRRVKVRVSPGDEPDAPPKKVKFPPM